MKIFLANESKQKFGGGFSFMKYFRKFAGDYITDNYGDADIYFISGATIIDRKFVMGAKELGKKIVLRVDNIPKNSRNRNTSTSRLKDFADLADLVIYQSNWAKEYAGYFLNKNGPVIYNGVDTDIFNTNGAKWKRSDNSKVFLYSRFNRDESKRPDEAFYYFHQYWRKNQNAELWIMGKYSDNLLSANFDFFMGEKIKWLGILELQEEIAMFMRSADVLLLPYYNDACSNTLIEALQCGSKVETCLSGMTGGTPEILDLFEQGFDFSAKRMAEDYIKELKKL